MTVEVINPIMTSNGNEEMTLMENEVVYHMSVNLFGIIQIRDDGVFWKKVRLCTVETLPSFVYSFQQYMKKKYSSFNNRTQELIMSYYISNPRGTFLTECYIPRYLATENFQRDPAGIV